MIQKIKKSLLHLLCVVALSLGLSGCEPISFGGGSNEEDVITLKRCWALKSFCGVEAEVDIVIDLGKDGHFTIYQRSEQLGYTVFTGTYEADEENSLLSGVYSDGTSWATAYRYTVNVEAKELVLESVNTPTEVSVYVPAQVPASATLSTRSASVNDVKPL